jgi:uncharacterized Zn finger protein (UPF0148 family)
MKKKKGLGSIKKISIPTVAKGLQPVCCKCGKTDPQSIWVSSLGKNVFWFISPRNDGNVVELAQENGEDTVSFIGIDMQNFSWSGNGTLICPVCAQEDLKERNLENLLSKEDEEEETPNGENNEDEVLVLDREQHEIVNAKIREFNELISVREQEIKRLEAEIKTLFTEFDKFIEGINKSDSENK